MVKMKTETIQDALLWVKTLAEHYRDKYPGDPRTALKWVIHELETTIIIGEMPECEGTRFKDATEKLIAVNKQ